MQLLKAIWQLCSAAAAAVVNLGRLIVATIALPVSWLAEKIGGMAKSIQGAVSKLEEKLDAQNPNGKADPVNTVIAVAILLFVVVPVLLCICSGLYISISELF